MEMNGMMKHFLWFAVGAIAVALCGVDARAQGSRKDDIVFNAHGTAATKPSFLVVGFVEAARIKGGQPFVPPRTRLNHYPRHAG
jgi:hypothetical protein